MIQEIILSVLLFTGILLLMTVLILWVRARLVPKGDVTINVNEERDLQVAVGSKLLTTLAIINCMYHRPVVVVAPVVNVGSLSPQVEGRYYQQRLR